jgi:ubiquinone/menaquinone biosynthesis C-methylase UbiE
MKYRTEKRQKEVTEFYDNLVYPSRVSDKRYKELMEIKRGEVVGDFGCGQSLFYDVFKNQEPSPTFFDISLNSLKTIDYGFRIKGDLQRIPLKSNKYDKIYCIGVIHHLPNMELAVSEINRVLKRNGLFCMGVYNNTTFQARYRIIYEQLKFGFLKKIAFGVGKIILTMYHKKTKRIMGREIDLRARDWLLTPLVRYLPQDFYKSLLERNGFVVLGVDRISTMDIYFSQKTSK